jgi:hypothetical protein
LHRGSREADEMCVHFKRNHRLDALDPHDELQNLLAEAYRVTRDGVINLFDLSNLVPRLRTFATDAAESADDLTDALELKPNLFGIGVNLNYFLKRLRRPWRKHR